MVARWEHCLLFDWGDTIMRVFPAYGGPMYTWPQVAAVPGSAEALAALQPDWQIAIATNAGDSTEVDIRAALHRVDLDRFFDRIYCYHNIGHKKPAQEFFAAILADLGLPAAQVVMVGDDFALDVLAPNACGLRAVWFNPAAGEPRQGPLYRTTSDLRQLPQLLRSFR